MNKMTVFAFFFVIAIAGNAFAKYKPIDPLDVTTLEEISLTIGAAEDDLIIVGTREHKDHEGVIVFNKMKTPVAGIGYLVYKDGRIEQFNDFRCIGNGRDSMHNIPFSGKSLENKNVIGIVVLVKGVKNTAIGISVHRGDDAEVTISPR